MTEGQKAILFLFAVGVFLIYIGVSGLLGYRRSAYIFPLEYGYVTSLANYGSIPAGLTAISWAILMILAPHLSMMWQSICLYASLPFGILAVLLGMFQPKFMMPKWYRWLKENHGEILPLLSENVRQMGYDTWRKRTATQRGLEEWVAEVRWRHGMDENGEKLTIRPVTRRIREEMQRLDYDTWRKLMANPEAMKEWMEEVERKYWSEIGGYGG